MHRLFVAVDLPDDVKDGLLGLMRDVPGARWVKRHQLHLTIRFIGEVETTQFKAVQRALQGVQSEPFELRLNGVGRFPPKGRPRVLWVGVDDQPALMALHERIENALVGIGLAADDRPFSAHITLARLKDPVPRDVTDGYLAKHKRFQTDMIPVHDFVLYSSVLSPQGPTYRAEDIYHLSD